MFMYVNKNPKNKKTNDSVVRAISTCVGRKYDSIYRELFNHSLVTRYSIFDRNNVDRYMEKIGFMRVKEYRRDRKLLTVDEVSKMIDEPAVVFTLKKHLTCIKNGNIYDTIDVSQQKASSIFIWVG